MVSLSNVCVVRIHRDIRKYLFCHEFDLINIPCSSFTLEAPSIRVKLHRKIYIFFVSHCFFMACLIYIIINLMSNLDNSVKKKNLQGQV